MMNHLAGQQSPYLIQHMNNPVDWHPWGDEALALARSLDRPVFLSIGYSTCHWCHVMERESFENEAVAAALNGSFVSIKVDREERPDIDRVYMTACQMMTGSGGWPLTIIMTPAGKPFFAATYLPRESTGDWAGLLEILDRVGRIWKERRGEIDASASSIADALGGGTARAVPFTAGGEFLGRAAGIFARQYDAVNGGFGESPKFPSPHNLLFLLRRWKLAGDTGAGEMALETLRRMRQGGIYDQVGFGFHRYSTDERWLVPHFEKMLYDQAMLAMAYAEAYQAGGDPLYAQTAREIFEYVSRDMTAPEGCFYSAEDADSEGREGAFYLWKADEITGLLGADDGKLAIEAYCVEAQGNFRDEATGRMEGENILHLDGTRPVDASIERIREMLFAAREKRPRPFRDDKALTDWNGLMIAALALGARALDDERYLGMARNAASFIISRMMTGDRLLHRYRNGDSSVPGNLDDYAFFVWGLIELYQAGFDPAHLDLALRLSSSMLKYFSAADGSLAFAPADGEKLFAAAADNNDGAYPSGNSVAHYNLVRLARLTGDPAWEASSERVLAGAGEGLRRYPQGYGMLLASLQYALGESCEVVLAADQNDEAFREMLREVRREYRPGCLVLFRPLVNPDSSAIVRMAPFTASMEDSGGGPAAFVCRGKRCFPPVKTAPELQDLLKTKST